MAAKVAGTWQVLDVIGVGDLTAIGTTLLHPLGTRVKARDVGATDYGLAEFIYLAGVTSTVRGSCVTIAAGYGTALAVARAKGAVAVALAANVGSSYGWYQILGKGVVLADTAVTSGLQLYIDGTTGSVDDDAVAGDAIIGMVAASTVDTATIVFHMTTYPATADFDNA
jgi:hypothetical protein